LAAFDNKVYSVAIALLEEVVVVNEAIILILENIKDGTLATVDSSHVTDLVSDTRLPILSQDGVAGLNGEHFTTSRDHFHGQLVLLSGDE